MERGRRPSDRAQPGTRHPDSTGSRNGASSRRSTTRPPHAGTPHRRHRSRGPQGPGGAGDGGHQPWGHLHHTLTSHRTRPNHGRPPGGLGRLRLRLGHVDRRQRPPAWLPAEHHPADWSPGLAPQIGAAVWPIGLLLSVEVLSRIHWPKGWQWTLARFGGTGTVALGSAVISYGHLRDLLLAWHYGPLAAAVGPLVLDGLMVISGCALLAMSRTPIVN
ncbi:DUF2637 domain-containing protein [Actinosynnema sp. CA-248983]